MIFLGSVSRTLFHATLAWNRFVSSPAGPVWAMNTVNPRSILAALMLSSC